MSQPEKVLHLVEKLYKQTGSLLDFETITDYIYEHPDTKIVASISSKAEDDCLYFVDSRCNVNGKKYLSTRLKEIIRKLVCTGKLDKTVDGNYIPRENTLSRRRSDNVEKERNRFEFLYKLYEMALTNQRAVDEIIIKLFHRRDQSHNELAELKRKCKFQSFPTSKEQEIANQNLLKLTEERQTQKHNIIRLYKDRDRLAQECNKARLQLGLCWRDLQSAIKI